MSTYNSRTRKLDLSAKFLEMGQCLQDEGDRYGNPDIARLGTILIFLASLTLNEEDLNKFSELVEMFLAKNTLDKLERDNHPIFDMIKSMSNRKTYDEIIEDLKKSKEDLENDKE